jgi:transposase InsO family protein
MWGNKDSVADMFTLAAAKYPDRTSLVFQNDRFTYAELNAMLDCATITLKEEECPVVHSDRGAHYRWPGWINRMEEAGLERSMFQKGCPPDNAACEGFFGRLKNEMFYDRSWIGVAMEGFMGILNKYLICTAVRLKFMDRHIIC